VGVNTAKDYPAPLRRIHYVDPETGKGFIFLTNDMLLPAIVIAQLYKARWLVELFFKWVKQHLRIKAFYGTSENAVKTQLWISVCVYLLVAILKKRMVLSYSIHTILQILSLTLFEKTPILQVFDSPNYTNEYDCASNQLELFALTWYLESTVF
jgi:hypothetical protein